MGEKETMSGEALRESPSHQSLGSTSRESSTASVSEREASTGQASGRGENIGSSGQDSGRVAAADVDGDGVSEAAAAKTNTGWDIKKADKV